MTLNKWIFPLFNLSRIQSHTVFLLKLFVLFSLSRLTEQTYHRRTHFIHSQYTLKQTLPEILRLVFYLTLQFKQGCKKMDHFSASNLYKHWVLKISNFWLYIISGWIKFEICNTIAKEINHFLLKII